MSKKTKNEDLKNVSGGEGYEKKRHREITEELRELRNDPSNSAKRLKGHDLLKDGAKPLDY